MRGDASPLIGPGSTYSPTSLVFAHPIDGISRRAPMNAAMPSPFGCAMPCPSNMRSSGLLFKPFRAFAIAGPSLNERYPVMYGKSDSITAELSSRLFSPGKLMRQAALIILASVNEASTPAIVEGSEVSASILTLRLTSSCISYMRSLSLGHLRPVNISGSIFITVFFDELPQNADDGPVPVLDARLHARHLASDLDRYGRGLLNSEHLGWICRPVARYHEADDACNRRIGGDLGPEELD